MRRLIRKFALWLNSTTERWIMPDKLWKDTQSEEFAEALDWADFNFPNDPYITYCRTVRNLDK